MSDSNKNVLLNIRAGDTSGLRELAQLLEGITRSTAELVAGAQSQRSAAALGEQGADLQGRRLELEALALERDRERTQVQALRIKELEVVGQNAQAARDWSEDNRGRMDRFQAGALGSRVGAGAVDAISSGDYAEMASLLFHVAGRANPWLMAGGAAAGAAAGVAYHSLTEQAEKHKAVRQAWASLAPYIDGVDPTAVNKPGFHAYQAGRAYGYAPAEAIERWGAYAGVAGLATGDGLSPASIFALERTRGITAEQSGAFSSAFAAGGGATGNVHASLSAAIADGLSAGLRNAHLPQYLEAVHGAMTRFTGRGLDVSAFDTIGTIAGIRRTSPDAFAGLRGVQALGALQGVGESALGMLRGLVPQDYLQSVLVAQMLQRHDGDLYGAYSDLERRTADGRIVGDLSSISRTAGGGLGAMMLLGATGGALGARQARALLGYGGRRPVTGAEFDDGSALGMWSRQYMVQSATDDLFNLPAGEDAAELERYMEDAKRASKRGAAGVLSTVINEFEDALTGLFGSDSVRRAAGHYVPEPLPAPIDFRPLEERFAPDAMRTRPIRIRVDVRDPRTGTIEETTVPATGTP